MRGHKPFAPEKTSYRPARFAERVKQELVDLVPGRLRDPRLQGLGLITFTSVEITPDLKHASVMFSLLGEEGRAKEVEAALNQAAGFLRRELMYKLSTKITPTLLFRYDKGLAATVRVDALLKEIARGETTDEEESEEETVPVESMDLPETEARRKAPSKKPRAPRRKTSG